MKVGLYGGTFDPIHLGHLQLAVAIREAKELDEVWLVPTGVNPFKVDKQVTEGEHRLAMAKLAVANFSFLKVIDHEIRRPGVSYAIDTLKELLQEFPNYEFSIIVGEDAAMGLPKWKEIEEVRSLVPIWIGKRKGESFFPEAVETPIFEVSSTDIRKRLGSGRECHHLVPGKVLDYIHTHQLY